MKNVPTLIPAPMSTRNWCFPFLHPWSKWRVHATQTLRSTHSGRQVGGVVHQHRWCARCDKLQVRKVNVV